MTPWTTLRYSISIKHLTVRAHFLRFFLTDCLYFVSHREEQTARLRFPLLKFTRHITDNEANETITFFAHLKNECLIWTLYQQMKVLWLKKIWLYCAVKILETSYLFSLNRFDNILFSFLLLGLHFRRKHSRKLKLHSSADHLGLITSYCHGIIVINPKRTDGKLLLLEISLSRDCSSVRMPNKMCAIPLGSFIGTWKLLRTECSIRRLFTYKLVC